MRGPGTNEDQIRSLTEKVGAIGVQSANSIVGEYSVDVIALAYKMTRNSRNIKLPKSVTKLIDNLPEEEAAMVRDKLVTAMG